MPWIVARKSAGDEGGTPSLEACVIRGRNQEFCGFDFAVVALWRWRGGGRPSISATSGGFALAVVIGRSQASQAATAHLAAISKTSAQPSQGTVKRVGGCGYRATLSCERICIFSISPKFMCGLVHKGGARYGACRTLRR